MQITIIKKLLNEKQENVLNQFLTEAHRYDPITKKNVPVKSIKTQAGGGWIKRDVSGKIIDASDKSKIEENQEHEFIKNELAKRQINAINIEKHPDISHVIVDKDDKAAAEQVLMHHGLDKEYHVKIAESLHTAEQEGRDAKKVGKKSSECPYGEEGSWDEKHSHTAWHKGYNSKNESLDESINKDYESAAKLAKELTAYANSLKTSSSEAQLAYYKAFEAHFKAYDLAQTDPKHKDHLKQADKYLHLAGHTLSEMANSGYVSGLQKSVNTLKAHLQRHGLEHTFTQQHVNKTLKALGHDSQITHHEGLHDLRKVTDNNKPAPSAAELIVRHLSIHGAKNESLDESHADEILSHLSHAHHSLMNSDAYSADAKKTFDKMHDLVRAPLMKNDVKGFESNWNHIGMKHPDHFGEYAEATFSHAGLNHKSHFTDFIQKTRREAMNESEGSTKILIKKHQKNQVETALRHHNIGHSSYPVDVQHHGISYDKKDEAKVRTALIHFKPVEDNSIEASDKVRTTDFDRVEATAAKVKRRNDIKKALNRKKKIKESDEEFESVLISESVDIDAIKKLSAAIKANPEIEDALFQLISAIITNPKMFENNPSSVINKIAASSKVPVQKLQAVVDALGIN